MCFNASAHTRPKKLCSRALQTLITYCLVNFNIHALQTLSIY
ncbi:hypothetical protein HMPREF1585_01461 [Gardnerella vaginalis JCP8481B]|nr:hypothetical protein HMPREF1585_01461 [Gardnerella vaginalis JCP8481B]